MTAFIYCGNISFARKHTIFIQQRKYRIYGKEGNCRGIGQGRHCAYLFTFHNKPFAPPYSTCRLQIKHSIYYSEFTQTTRVQIFHSIQQTLSTKWTHPTNPQLKTPCKHLTHNTKHSSPHYQEKSVHMANTTFTPSSTVPNKMIREKTAPRSWGSGMDERKESSMKAWQIYCPSSA